MRIVLVEWRIKKGREDEFLRHWSLQASVKDRTGLVGEFLSEVKSCAEIPWITWEYGDAWTTYFNVGFWRDLESFGDQIGAKIDDDAPILSFEYERHRRTFLGPERWRLGGTMLPLSSHPLVY